MKNSQIALARTILGADFIQPEEVSESRKLTYSSKLLKHFTETFPSEEILQWLCKNGFILIAGPFIPMSLLEVREINTQLFFAKSGGWYEEQKENFSRNDKVMAEWLMLRKGVIRNSVGGKTWKEQQKFLAEMEYVPNIAEAVWGETTYKEVRNDWLFPSIYARTSSIYSNGHHVHFGDSEDGGVDVGGRYDFECYSSIGLTSARK